MSSRSHKKAEIPLMAAITPFRFSLVKHLKLAITPLLLWFGKTFFDDFSYCEALENAAGPKDILSL